MSGETKAIKVGVLGLGNIGAGTVEILKRNGGLIERRLGVPFEVVKAADLDPARAEKLGLPRGVFTTDAKAVVSDPEVQVVVELIGGIEPARTLILAAMEHGKHVVTANKALLSTHWEELVTKAEAKRVSLGFEGSVGGAPDLANPPSMALGPCPLTPRMASHQMPMMRSQGRI